MTADAEWDTQIESRNPSDAKIPLMYETGTLIACGTGANSKNEAVSVQRISDHAPFSWFAVVRRTMTYS
jgi:hypothetical protein